MVSPWQLTRREYIEQLALNGPLRVVLIHPQQKLVAVRVLPNCAVDTEGILHPYRAGFSVVADNGDAPKSYPNERWEEIIRRVGKDRIALGHYAAVQAALAKHQPLANKVLLDFLPRRKH